jgi:hypothetical protein
MAITNLAPNPCLKTDGSGFYGPDGDARADGLGTGMLRRYVWRGDGTGDRACPRVTATPGKWYRAAAQVKVYGACTPTAAVHLYSTGGSYQDASPGNGYVKSGADTFTMVSDSYQAAADTGEALLNLKDLPKCQVTAYIMREFDTQAAADAADMTYFDGDSAGGAWISGTDGPSTLDTSSNFSIIATLPEPLVRITSASVSSNFSIGLTLSSPTVSFGLITDVSYDDDRGRIRIDASGFPPEVVRVVVSRRLAGTFRWEEIRGGRVAVVAGALARIVDDYEFAAGELMDYRLVAYSTPENVPDQIVFSRVLSCLGPLTAVWVKFIPRPSMNRRVRMSLWDPIEYEDNSQVYKVDGAPDRVVVSSPHSSAQTTVRFFTETLAERDALVSALRGGYPFFLHTPLDLAFPSMYATAGPIRTELRGDKFGTKHVVAIPITEVAPPPLSVVPTGATWQSVIDTYGTWDDVLAANATWAELIDG